MLRTSLEGHEGANASLFLMMANLYIPPDMMGMSDTGGLPIIAICVPSSKMGGA